MSSPIPDSGPDQASPHPVGLADDRVPFYPLRVRRTRRNLTGHAASRDRGARRADRHQTLRTAPRHPPATMRGNGWTRVPSQQSAGGVTDAGHSEAPRPSSGTMRDGGRCLHSPETNMVMIVEHGRPRSAAAPAATLRREPRRRSRTCPGIPPAVFSTPRVGSSPSVTSRPPCWLCGTPGSDTDCLTAQIGVAAKLRVKEGRNGPRFALWEPFPRRVGAWVREKAEGIGGSAPDQSDEPSAPSGATVRASAKSLPDAHSGGTAH